MQHCIAQVHVGGLALALRQLGAPGAQRGGDGGGGRAELRLRLLRGAAASLRRSAPLLGRHRLRDSHLQRLVGKEEGVAALREAVDGDGALAGGDDAGREELERQKLVEQRLPPALALLLAGAEDGAPCVKLAAGAGHVRRAAPP
jgi:hypothetical protein